jgi:opacity protein-like surface antigen
MKRLAACMLVLLCCPGFLRSEDVTRTEVFAGFSILSVEGAQGLGWQASAKGNLNGSIGIVADVGGHYRFHLSAYQYLFGPELTRRGRTALFAHALIGGARLEGFDSSTNRLALAFGGGVDLNATDRIAVRLFQLDWIPTRFEQSWQNRTGRIGFGLVFRPGR